VRRLLPWLPKQLVHRGGNELTKLELGFCNIGHSLHDRFILCFWPVCLRSRNGDIRFDFRECHLDQS